MNPDSNCTDVVDGLQSSLFSAMSFIGITYAECNETLAMTFMIAGLSPMGFYYPSVKVNALDLSPNYAATIGSLAQMGSCTAGVLVPYVFGITTINGTMREWRIMFWTSSVIALVGGIVFLLLSSAEEQLFNDYYAHYLHGHSLSTISGIAIHQTEKPSKTS